MNQQLLTEIAGSRFFQSQPDQQADILTLLNQGLIQPIRQGKLTGYAVTPVGYRQWLGHQQRANDGG